MVLQQQIYNVDFSFSIIYQPDAHIQLFWVY